MKQILVELAHCIEVEPRLERALELARHYGNFCWSMNVGIFDNPELERSLARRLKAEAGSFKRSDLDQRDALHVVSEPYLTGGHTRLMEKLAGMHDSRPDLMITRASESAVVERLSTHFSSIHRADAISQEIERIHYMVGVMAVYQRIVLSLHPDDIAAVLACILAKEVSGARIFLVNHADHGFTFGSAAADVYFELSSYGRRVDEKKSIVGQKSFLGIPLAHAVSNQGREASAPRADAGLLFLSAGSDTKFKPRRGADIRPLIATLLKRFPSAQFMVIGPNLLRDRWWWPLKIRFLGRLKLMRHLPFDEYAQVVKRASFYVDSHPFPGGTAFAEQLMAGQRCIGLISPFQGYSPAERLKSIDSAAVIDTVLNYHLPADVMTQVICVNGYENVQRRYLDAVYAARYAPNLIDEFCSWTGDVEFMQAECGARNVDMSAEAFLGVLRGKSRLALRVFLTLRMSKKVKLVAKLVVQCIKHHRAGVAR